MTLQRMKWLLLGVPGIFLFTWATFAVQQQVVKRIDDKTLKATPKGTEWLSNGMNWALAAEASRRLLSIRTVSFIPLRTGASSPPSMRKPGKRSGGTIRRRIER